MMKDISYENLETVFNIRELFKDMGRYFPSLVIPAIVGFITIPIATRLFSAEIYGNYVLVVGIIAALSTVAGWVSVSIVRFYPVYKKNLELDKFRSTTIKLNSISVVAFSFIFLCVLSISKDHISTDLYYLMRIGLLVFVLASFFDVLQQFQRAKRQVKQYTGFSLWWSITSIGLGVVLIIIFHRGIDGLLWGSILSMAIALPLLWKSAIGKFSIRTRSFSFPLTLEMAKYSLPMVIGNLAVWILISSDRYVLEFFRGSYEVGIYSVSYGISQRIIMLIVSLFLMAGSPIGINIWEHRGEKGSQEFLNRLTRYYVIICLPAVVGLSVLAKPLMRMLVAQEYYDGHQIVPLIASSIFLYGLVYKFGHGLSYYKKTYPAALCNIAAGSLNLGLNFLLVPKFGYRAAAVTTLVSYVFVLVSMIFISRRYFVWKFPFESLIKVVCASIVMGVIVYVIGNSLSSVAPLNLILGTGSGVLIYCGMLFLLREFKPNEIQTLLALKAKIWK